MTKSNDEIDLLELLAKAILIAKKNFLLIVSMFFLGLVLGVGFNQLAAKKYGSSMLITSDVITESYAKELIKTLNGIRGDGNLKLLSEKLHLSIEDIKKIRLLKVKSAIERLDGIQERDRIYLTLSAEVSNVDVLPNLETALVAYFENNPFVKIRVENKRVLYSKLNEQISKEIEDLEKIKENILKGSLSRDNSFTLDPSAINGRIIDLTRWSLENENNLKTLNSVQIVEGFTAYQEPISPKLSFSIAGGTSLGLFFAFCIITFKGIRKMIRLSEEKLGQV